MELPKSFMNHDYNYPKFPKYSFIYKILLSDRLAYAETRVLSRLRFVKLGPTRTLNWRKHKQQM